MIGLANNLRTDEEAKGGNKNMVLHKDIGNNMD